MVCPAAWFYEEIIHPRFPQEIKVRERELMHPAQPGCGPFLHRRGKQEECSGLNFSMGSRGKEIFIEIWKNKKRAMLEHDPVEKKAVLGF